jgi:hypothetical protein
MKRSRGFTFRLKIHKLNLSDNWRKNSVALIFLLYRNYIKIYQINKLVQYRYLTCLSSFEPSFQQSFPLEKYDKLVLEAMS